MTGKTVQMIATMAMNLPALEDQSRTTLVVVPAALLQQVGFPPSVHWQTLTAQGSGKMKLIRKQTTFLTFMFIMEKTS
jgi:SNF2 family DNA or RNA helicase